MGDRFSFLLPARSNRRLSGSGEESVASSSHLDRSDGNTEKNVCQGEKAKKSKNREKTIKHKKLSEKGLTKGNEGNKISAIESKGCDEDG